MVAIYRRRVKEMKKEKNKIKLENEVSRISKKSNNKKFIIFIIILLILVIIATIIIMRNKKYETAKSENYNVQ